MTNQGCRADEAESRSGSESPSPGLGHWFPRLQPGWWRTWTSCDRPGGPASPTEVSARITSRCPHPP